MSRYDASQTGVSPGDVSRDTVSRGDWAALAADIRTCVACDLAGARTQAVPGVPGRGRHPLLLVGEAPGAAEDATGLPFVGRSGQLLDVLLGQAGLDRTDIAVANVVRCRPPGNRAPRAAEVRTCRPWLSAQIQMLKPALIVALGGTATTWFLGPRARLSALRGQVQSWQGHRLLVTYHPSAALRFGPRGAPRQALAEDLVLAAQMLRVETAVAPTERGS